jgi:DNA repair exonuclease SbcCD ATPase subunit
MKLGDLLLLKGYINNKQLKSALGKQAKEAINYNRSVPLGKILIEEGHVTINEVTEALNDQQLKGIKEEKVMATEIGEGSKFTFDLKFIATLAAILVSASATYFSITGQVDDNRKEIDNIKSMGDLKIISYKLEEYDETFKDLKSLSTTLSPLATDLAYIKEEIQKLKNKKINIPEVDLSGIDDCKDKLDALSAKIEAFEERVTKLEGRKSGGGRF